MRFENQSNVTLKCLTARCRAAPPSTAAYAMCSIGPYVYLFGGRQYLADASPFSNELWCLDVSDLDNLQWEKVGTTNPPPPRWGHTMQYYKGHLIVFGGSQIGATYNDVWVLDIRKHHPPEDALDGGRRIIRGKMAWRQVVLAETDPTPTPRGGHSAVIMVGGVCPRVLTSSLTFHGQGSQSYIFGGNDMSNSYGDLWTLDLEEVLSVASSLSSTSLLASSPESSPSVGFYRDGSTSPTDAGLSGLWRKVEEPSGQQVTPSSRIGHTAVALGSRYFLVYGGRDYIKASMSEGERESRRASYVI